MSFDSLVDALLDALDLTRHRFVEEPSDARWRAFQAALGRWNDLVQRSASLQSAAPTISPPDASPPASE